MHKKIAMKTNRPDHLEPSSALSPFLCLACSLVTPLWNVPHTFSSSSSLFPSCHPASRWPLSAQPSGLCTAILRNLPRHPPLVEWEVSSRTQFWSASPLTFPQCLLSSVRLRARTLATALRPHELAKLALPYPLCTESRPVRWASCCRGASV